MKHPTCESILIKYLAQNSGVHKKVHLYAVAEDFSAETVGRCLRTMEKKGIIHVSYYDGKYSKGLAQYSYEKPLRRQLVLTEDGRAVYRMI